MQNFTLDMIRHLELNHNQDWEVPPFEFSDLADRQSKYCLMIPVLNEGNKLLNQLKMIQGSAFGIDVIIVDGGSSDDSTRENVIRDLGVTALIRLMSPPGLSSQMRAGFCYSLMKGYQGIIAIDGNGKDGIEGIPEFIRHLDLGFDFVQGSRYIPGGIAENTPWDRNLAVKFIHAPLISLAAKRRYTDTTNGFRAFSSHFLMSGLIQPFRHIFHRYNLHYYLAVRAGQCGFQVTEIPVRRSYPKSGPTPTKIGGVRGRLIILSELFSAIFGAYNPRNPFL